MTDIIRHDGRTGVFAGVPFTDGEGHTDAPGRLRYFRRHPDTFSVLDADGEPEDGAEPFVPEGNADTTGGQVVVPGDEQVLTSTGPHTVAEVAHREPEDGTDAPVAEAAPYAGLDRKALQELADMRGLPTSGSATKVRERLIRADKADAENQLGAEAQASLDPADVAQGTEGEPDVHSGQVQADAPAGPVLADDPDGPGLVNAGANPPEDTDTQE